MWRASTWKIKKLENVKRWSLHLNHLWTNRFTQYTVKSGWRYRRPCRMTHGSAQAQTKLGLGLTHRQRLWLLTTAWLCNSSSKLVDTSESNEDATRKKDGLGSLRPLSPWAHWDHCHSDSGAKYTRQNYEAPWHLGNRSGRSLGVLGQPDLHS